MMEMMVVIILIGIIAGFAIPIYTKSLAKAEERNAAINLALIAEGMSRHMIAEDLTAMPTLSDIAAINTTLGIYVIDDQGSYSCTPSVGALDNVCEYDSEDGTWGLQFHDDQRLVHCQASVTCPTCQPSGSGGCQHYF
jgi:type II secretory pathway pseudopilin PulG